MYQQVIKTTGNLLTRLIIACNLELIILTLINITAITNFLDVHSATTMLHRSLAVGAGNFWCPENFKNWDNPKFENIKHLKNLVTLPQTSPFMLKKKV